MQFCYRGDDAESKSVASRGSAALHSVEPLEYMLALRLGHSVTVIRDREFDAFWPAFERYRYHCSGGRMRHCVFQQVGE